MAASLTLSDADAGQLRVTGGVLSRFSRIEGTLMDISGGGAGLVVGEYVPKWASVTLGVHRGEGMEEALLRARCVVRRVQMLDRRPSYLLGVGFEGQNESEVAQLAGLIAEIDGVEASPT